MQVKKSVKLLPLLVISSTLSWNIQSREFTLRTSCKDRLLQGKITLDLGARAIQYRYEADDDNLINRGKRTHAFLVSTQKRSLSFSTAVVWPSNSVLLPCMYNLPFINAITGNDLRFPSALSVDWVSWFWGHG